MTIKNGLSLIADLTADLPVSTRAQRFVRALHERFRCDAVGLLRFDGEGLVPLALEGLTQEAMGRRFLIAQHPRFESITARQEPVRFMPGDPRPDPYDGLLDQHLGQPLPVHDCLGISLYIEGRLWGALTLDALEGKSFTPQDIADLSDFARIAEASMRVSRLEEDNRGLRLLRGSLAVEAGRLSEETDILGQSPIMRNLLHEIDVVSDSDLPILVLGETGVGKELFALRVHQRSARRNQPMIHVNCAALPESLAESELFGHCKGAFSGATADRAGRIEAADGGTLFLDEVGELPLTVQAKLLRTLQNGEIQRLGEDKPRKTNVRIVSATNRNLAESIRAGRFRADLYHRLSVYPIHIPALRDRGADVLLLAGRFLELNRARLGLHSLRLSDRAQEVLCAYAWPGNVRELEHVISRAALRAVTQGANRDDIVTIEPNLLALDVSQQGSVDASGAQTTQMTPLRQTPDLPLRRATELFQQERIRSALDRNQGNWSAAARTLGMDTSNLLKLAKRLGIR